jgi:hypothetical protein
VISWIVSVRSGNKDVHEITRSNTNGKLLTRELDLTFEAKPSQSIGLFYPDGEFSPDLTGTESDKKPPENLPGFPQKKPKLESTTLASRKCLTSARRLRESGKGFEPLPAKTSP